MVNLSGKKIIQTITSNLSDVFTKDPYLQMGGDCTRISNSKMHVLISQHGADRIKSLTINGKPINPDKNYRIITSGAKMQKLSNTPELGLQKERAYDVIADYVRKNKSVKSIQTGSVIYRRSKTAG